MIKLSDYVIRFIADLGIKHVFMVPGGGAMHLNDSLGYNPDIDFVCNHHEQASAIAAEAYARVTNNLGVALVTSGPGGTNAVTGVTGAWLDSTPCLFISGQVKRTDLSCDLGVRQLGTQEINIVSIVSAITKYAVTIMDPLTIRYHLEKAIYLAKSGRPGPVWLDIPLDVQASMVCPDDLNRFDPGEIETAFDKNKLKEDVARFIDLLNNSERPVLLAGNGIRLAGAQTDFLLMKDQLGIPVLTTRLGIDLIPETHALLIGMPGAIGSRAANFALQNSDLLLILGARLDMAITAYSHQKLARAAKKVMVNIDPAEIQKMKTTIDIPICVDVKFFITEVLRQASRIKFKNRTAWITRCQNWKSKYPIVLPEHRAQKNEISLYSFSEILSDELTGEDIVLPGSSGLASEIFLTTFKVKFGQRVFHNKGTGAMGFCQPAAIGACLASSQRRTICVDGDGGFQLNIQELETVRRLNLPIKFFVINNQGFASIRSSQRNYFGRLTGADASSGLTLPDTVKVAASYGLRSVRISNGLNLRQQVRKVLNLPGPVVCEVAVIPDEPRAPRVLSIQRPDGSMVSKPLEDMWPFLDRQEFLSNMIIPPLNK